MMRFLKREGMKWSNTDIFILLALINIVAVAIALFVTNGQFLSEIVWDARNDLFIDFTNEVRMKRGKAGFLLYAFIGRFIPDGVIDDSTVTRWSEMFLVIIISMCISMIVLIINWELKLDKVRIAILCMIFIVSAPFGFSCIKAGNTVYLSLVFIMLALVLREQESLVAREAALLLIVAAADIKLAPAILGVLYIKDKRYKEAVRLAIYGAIVIIGFQLAFGDMAFFIRGITSHNELIQPRPETIIGVVIEAGLLLGLTAETALKIGSIIAYVYFAVCMFLFFKCKKSWKTMCLLISILIIFLNMSYPYTLCYMLIPLIMFIKEEDSVINRRNAVYACLFALVFTVYPILRIDWPTATFITNYFFEYILIVMIIVDLFVGIRAERSKVYE